ncbi:MAG: DNA polymerase III subunit alpha, partial [Anaerolineales bacterium]|nr:DNA polymerase III subunit alpha [Anaerolineales bacterium]
LEGLASPAELVKTAAAHNMPALALTDRHYLTGAIEFYDACREAGLQPIIGLNLTVAAPAELDPEAAGPLVLLAQDRTGWASLCRLSSAIQTEPDYSAAGALPIDELAANARGLICLTGGTGGLSYRWLRSGRPDQVRGLLNRLADLFPGRLYVELQRQDPPDRDLSLQLAGLAGRESLPIVATHSIHYLTPGEADLQRTAAAMRLNLNRANLPASALAPASAAFPSSEDMASRFKDLPEALAATDEIRGRCRLELPLGTTHYPHISLPEGQHPNQALRERAYEGARQRYGGLTPATRERLEHELAIISDQGYAVLFLIMADVIEFAGRADIPSASRGSASSSLVAHCLGITTPDPMALNLYFERFLNPARRKPPDIDTDLDSRRRDQVIRYVYDTYGDDRVAMVCTINRLRTRSALREVAKAYGLSGSRLKGMMDSLPRRGWGPPDRRRDRTRPPYAELADRYRDPPFPQVFRDATALLGAPHHLSIHPGGLVISPGPLTDLTPTHLASKGIVITQFDLEPIERLGLVKIDLLGIRGLTVLADVADAVRDRRPRPRPGRLETLAAIPADDPHTAELLRQGHTIGCFQVESPGMRATLREIQASSPDDLMVALALYRPGPLTGGLKDAFVRRHLGQEAVSHLHPALEQLLGDTYGVILYQEQVLRLAHELGGLSLAEGDLLRRAMSHFDPGERLETLREKFIVGALEKNRVPVETGERLWEMMAAFAGYGFPKAHATSYAQLAWQSAWCKAHHPAEFLAGVLANWGGYYRQGVYLSEARRLGLALRPPHINYSRREFAVRYLEGEPALFMGLDQVKGLTRRSQKRILAHRPFDALSDFLERVDPRPEEAANLVRVGALDHLGSIPALLSSIEQGAWRHGQRSLFVLEPVGVEDWSLAEKSAAQVEVLGVSVDIHPLELVADQLAGQDIHTTLDAASQTDEPVRVAGIRQTVRRGVDARGRRVYRLVLEDLDGVLDVEIPEDLYRRSRSVISGARPFIVEGRIGEDQAAEEVTLVAERLWPLIKMA